MKHNLTHHIYTHEPPESLNMFNIADQTRYAELKNLEEQGKLEIMKETEIVSPRTVSGDGDVYPAEFKRIVEFVTVSKPLIDTKAPTEI